MKPNQSQFRDGVERGVPTGRVEEAAQKQKAFDYKPNKFERKLDNELGFKEENGSRTSVRVGPRVSGTTDAGYVLRASSTTTGKSSKSELPTRKRDVKKAVSKLRKEVSK